jgi:orotate phosphoribosyltransferase
MKPYQQTFIQLALSHHALKFGEFTLKSGRQSPYFFNVGQFNTGQALKTLGECYAQALIDSGMTFDSLFGPAYKGIPLACTTAIGMAAKNNQDVPYSFNRKEEKDHGEGGQIVGAPLKGKIVIVDDVVTKGTAVRESFDIIAKSTATISGILVALDRQERGQGHRSATQEIQEEFKVKVHAIINFDDIIDYVNKSVDFAKYKDSMHNYREQYGI